MVDCSKRCGSFMMFLASLSEMLTGTGILIAIST